MATLPTSACSEQQHAAASGSPPPPLATTDACTAPDMTPSVADKKRLKHREYVKKSYNKKINTIETLKSELEALEQQYATLLTIGSDSTAAATAPTERALSSSSTDSTHSNSPIMRKYMQLTDIKQRLQRENAALYRAAASHMKAEGRMHQLLQTEVLASAPALHTAPPFRCHSLPAAAYAQIIAAARDDVLTFMHRPDKLSSGARVFGWTDSRHVKGTTLQFALEKTFPGVSALALLQRSWAIFSSPTTFPLVYSPTLHVQFHELERIDADTVLMYRTIDADGAHARIKTVFVLARLAIADGFMLLFRSIDRSRIGFVEDIDDDDASSGRPAKANAAPDIWVDKDIWVIFKDCGADACVFHFGGSTTTSIWLKEVLFIALKWESLAVGPQITLTM